VTKLRIIVDFQTTTIIHTFRNDYTTIEITDALHLDEAPSTSYAHCCGMLRMI